MISMQRHLVSTEINYYSPNLGVAPVEESASKEHGQLEIDSRRHSISESITMTDLWD